MTKQIIYVLAKNVNNKTKYFQGFYTRSPVGKYSATKSTCSTVNTRPRRYSSSPASVGKVKASL
ncbi:Uncharacterised protein [Flavonifractor plautii]|uniref:Uncharacterized protein n=1 Tax=Flavonifractor plautii TaxID=292800 RepID=A0A174IHF9_FLAPL|nr:Uncharacterised protein [Flavonifractor plautii]